ERKLETGWQGGCLRHVRSLALGESAAVQAVLPALLPGERRGEERFERRAFQEVLDRPAVRGMGNHEDTRRALGREAGEEVARALHDVEVALPARERRPDSAEALGVDLGDRMAVELAVVALAQARILANDQGRPGEGGLRGLDRAGHGGGGDELDPVRAPALPERASGGLASLGEATGKPTGGDSGLIVGRERVGLVDQLDHATVP